MRDFTITAQMTGRGLEVSFSGIDTDDMSDAFLDELAAKIYHAAMPMLEEHYSNDNDLPAA